MFKGVYTAIVTPLTDEGGAAYDALEKLRDLQIQNKVAGIVPIGTTGESPTLHEDENGVTIAVYTPLNIDITFYVET
jgi:4-hydroxy-tetrahydrodipicolinate synthase